MLTSLFDLPVETGATPKSGLGGKPRVQRANREQVTMRLAALDDLLSNLIAVSVMFPLFLVARQIAISRQQAQPSAVDQSPSAGSSP